MVKTSKFKSCKNKTKQNWRQTIKAIKNEFECFDVSLLHCSSCFFLQQQNNKSCTALFLLISFVIVFIVWRQFCFVLFLRDKLWCFYDICVINDRNFFFDNFKDIYPKELEPKLEHQGSRVTFLDLDIEIKDGVFV